MTAAQQTPLDIDDPARIDALRRRIADKPALTALYTETYDRYRQVLARCPEDGLAVELGSGAGFARRVIPDLVTSDVLPYDGVDRVVDATAMPFEDASVRALFLLNVFHHIPDAAAFLREASRCLVPGGRIFMHDQHVGVLTRQILKHLHDEPFDPNAERWRFDTSGPLSGANGALAWIVFQRDRDQLAQRAPALELVEYRPHTPLRYWLAGGLKPWSLLPGPLFGLATQVDRLLARATTLCSFVDIELVKRK